MLWLTFFALGGLMDAAGSAAGGGAGAGPTSSPSSAPAASTPASGGTPPASPSGTPTPVAQPASGTPPSSSTPTPDDLQDGNWRELRTRYEQQKAQIATLTSQSAAASQVMSHAQSIAKTLGYSDQDFAEAFTSNPVRTLEILQQEAADKASSAPPDKSQTDLTKQLEEMVKAKLDPIAEFQNRQATEVAMSKYESTLGDLIKADPILSTAPEEVVSVVKDYLGEYFSGQPDILMAMKTKGDFSSVSDALKFVAGRLHGAFKAWLAKSGTQSPSPSPVAGRPNGRPTLDQIINDPGILGSQYKE